MRGQATRFIRRYLPWTIAAIAVIAFGFSFAELQRVRARFGELTHHKFHDHQDVRRFMIGVALSETSKPIVVLGDSVVEMARLPVELCGHPVVNAGIGGATASDISYLAPAMFRNQQPSLILVVLGANDVGNPDIESRYESLFALLKQRAETIAASSTADGDIINASRTAAKASQIAYFDIPIPSGDLFDGIHFTSTGYAKWLPQLNAAIAGSLRCEAGMPKRGDR
jgi:lysophospholipase L1-like esterase